MTDTWRTSVVMTVYHRVAAEDFRRALGSIVEQTLPPDEVVVVEDGPLGRDLLAVLDGYDGGPVPLVRRALSTNSGSAIAAQAGVEVASHPWIVRMDADDVAVPHRLEAQMAVLRDGGLDVVGSAMQEFQGDEANVVGTRRLPTHHADIVRYARVNSPVNNPTAVIRRSALLAVGGYRPVPFMEDYDVFARLLAAGYVFHNVPEPLVLFRASDDMFRRRKARGMFRAELQMQRNLHSYGMVSAPRAVLNVAARSAFRALPQRGLKTVYGRLFYRRGAAH